MKWFVIGVFILCVLLVHFRGRVRHPFLRQLGDHSTFLAPLNAFMFLTSRVPNVPYHEVERFPELQVLQDNWQLIRDEALTLLRAGQIKTSAEPNDAGFNSFFKSGWKRFYLKWYGDSHPSAMQLCPRTTELLRGLGTVKAAMFAELPPGSRLVRHRDPYGGSLRYHLGLVTPNDPRCFIEVDGRRYHWRDGQAVVFDETFIHYAENATEQDRIILFCDVERPLRYRWADAFNRWVSSTLLASAASPNEAGDRTGGLNRAFKYLHRIRQRGKALKKRNRFRYYLEQWLLLAALAGVILWI